MRRLLFSLLALSLISVVGGCCHTHGVCDCDIDDHCFSRQPWLRHGGVAAPVVGDPVVPAIRERAPGAETPTNRLPEKTRELPRELAPIERE